MDRHLDLVVWFDDLKLCDATGREISIEELHVVGSRWWQKVHDGEPEAVALGFISGRPRRGWFARVLDTLLRRRGRG